MSEADSDMDNLSPPEIIECAHITTDNLLPQKSRNIYEKFYSQFMDWRNRNKAGGSTGLLMDLAANEKAVHADFFNDFDDLYDDDDLQ